MSKGVKNSILIAIVAVFIIPIFIIFRPRGFADYSSSEYINVTYVRLSVQAGMA